MFQNSNQYASNIISLPDRNTAVAACGPGSEVDRAEQAAVQSGDGRASFGALLWRRVSQSAAIPAQQLLGLQEQLRRGSLADHSPYDYHLHRFVFSVATIAFSITGNC